MDPITESDNYSIHKKKNLTSINSLIKNDNKSNKLKSDNIISDDKTSKLSNKLSSDIMSSRKSMYNSTMFDNVTSDKNSLSMKVVIIMTVFYQHQIYFQIIQLS